MNADEIVDYHRKRANDFAFNTWNREFHEQTATLIEQQQKEIARLQPEQVIVDCCDTRLLEAQKEIEKVESAYQEQWSEIAGLRKEIADLKTKLTYAEDAAAKGNLARMTAGGMEMEIAELRKVLGIIARDCKSGSLDHSIYTVEAITAAMQETKQKT